MKQVNTEAVKSIKEQPTVFYITFLNLILIITILIIIFTVVQKM